jgi:hypothetical protein
MRALRGGVVAAVTVAAIGVAGCGSDGTGPEGTLTAEELQLAVSAIFNRSVVRAQRILPPRLPAAAFAGAMAGAGLADGGVAPDPGGPMAALVPVSADSLDLAVPCAVSGSIEILARYDGSVDDENGNYDVTYVVEQDHQSCVEGAGDGLTIELDGSPGVIARFDAFTLDDGVEGVSGEIRGTLEVTTDDGPVVCTLELNFTGEGPEGLIDYSFLGRLCGNNFEATFRSGL